MSSETELPKAPTHQNVSWTPAFVCLLVCLCVCYYCCSWWWWFGFFWGALFVFLNFLAIPSVGTFLGFPPIATSTSTPNIVLALNSRFSWFCLLSQDPPTNQYFHLGSTNQQHSLSQDPSTNQYSYLGSTNQQHSPENSVYFPCDLSWAGSFPTPYSHAKG